MDKKIIKENGYVRHINFDKIKKVTEDGSKTLLEMLINRCKNNPKDLFLGSIKNESISYDSNKKIFKKTKKLAMHLKKITQEKDFIGIYSVNRKEWTISEFASYMINCINVPLFSTFQPSAIEHIFNET